MLKMQMKTVKNLTLFNGLRKGCWNFVLMSNKNEIKVNHVGQNGKGERFNSQLFSKGEWRAAESWPWPLTPSFD